MARATKPPRRRAKAKAGTSAGPSPAKSSGVTGSLKGRVVTCSAPRRQGRWLVADDEGGKLVRLTRPQTNLSTWESRDTLTVV